MKKGILPGESCVLYLFSKVRDKIILISRGITDNEASEIGIDKVSNIEEAFSLIKKPNPTVYFLPNASYTYPIYEKS